MNRLQKKPESEKDIERYLREGVKAVCGGWCIKLGSQFVTGLPDRLLLFPGGCIMFAELKSTGKKQSARQVYVSNKLRALGFRVDVVDSMKAVGQIINEHARL